MGCQLVGDCGEIPVVALFPGSIRHPVQRREGGQLVAMVDQLLQHHVDDVGHRVFGLGRRVGHDLQPGVAPRSEEHTSELQSPCNLVCRLLLEKKKKKQNAYLEHDTHMYMCHHACNDHV